MYSFKICLIEKNTYSIKKYYTAILHQDSAFLELSICLCKSEFHARTLFSYSKYNIILFFVKSKTAFYWPLFWSDIHIYIYIYIIRALYIHIYTHLIYIIYIYIYIYYTYTIYTYIYLSNIYNIFNIYIYIYKYTYIYTYKFSSECHS